MNNNFFFLGFKSCLKKIPFFWCLREEGGILVTSNIVKQGKNKNKNNNNTKNMDRHEPSKSRRFQRMVIQKTKKKIFDALDWQEEEVKEKSVYIQTDANIIAEIIPPANIPIMSVDIIMVVLETPPDLLPPPAAAASS